MGGCFSQALGYCGPEGDKKAHWDGFCMFPCGGGGIPLIRKERKVRGVEAEIRKGLASAKLAKEINTHMRIVPSGVKGAAIPTPRVFTVSGMDIVEISRRMVMLKCRYQFQKHPVSTF